ncbi:hypothetical protein J6590_016162 [Homalodisca vitripennis]|nr:hypothetical protein J6590_016162 [Homalodisca vitripennis]
MDLNSFYNGLSHELNNLQLVNISLFQEKTSGDGDGVNLNKRGKNNFDICYIDDTQSNPSIQRDNKSSKHVNPHPEQNLQCSEENIH